MTTTFDTHYEYPWLWMRFEPIRWVNAGRFDNALPGVPVEVTIASHPRGPVLYQHTDPSLFIHQAASVSHVLHHAGIKADADGTVLDFAQAVSALVVERDEARFALKDTASAFERMRLELDHAHSVMDGLGQPRTGPNVAGPSLLGTRLVRYSRENDKVVGDMAIENTRLAEELAKCRENRDVWMAAADKWEKLAEARRKVAEGNLGTAERLRADLEAMKKDADVFRSKWTAARRLLGDADRALDAAGVPTHDMTRPRGEPTELLADERIAMLAASREDWKTAASQNQATVSLHDERVRTLTNELAALLRNNETLQTNLNLAKEDIETWRKGCSAIFESLNNWAVPKLSGDGSRFFGTIDRIEALVRERDGWRDTSEAATGLIACLRKRLDEENANALGWKALATYGVEAKEEP